VTRLVERRDPAISATRRRSIAASVRSGLEPFYAPAQLTQAALELPLVLLQLVEPIRRERI
jgi:hypothetical protein